MKLEITQPEEGLVRFEITSEDINKKNLNYSLGQKACHVELGKEIEIANIHPDLLGLASILISWPFIENKLELSIPVSKHFAGLIEKHTNYSIGPVDENISPRTIPANGVPALSFSGGSDSSAALAIMPEDTVLVFLLRDTAGCDFQVPGSLYKSEAPLKICNDLEKLGRRVKIVKCGLEYLRNPVGFPSDLSVGVPAILLSDHFTFDSLAFGTVMEAAYRVGHEKFQDYANRLHYTRWGSIFRGVGLELNMPVAGVSEVGTSMIVTRSKMDRYSQSCIRGSAEKPCLNCWKCFRKIIVNMSIEQNYNEELCSKLFESKEVKLKISKIPILHENVLTWATSKYSAEHPLLNYLKLRTRGDVLSCEWMERWYQPSRILIPEKYRQYISFNLINYLGMMSEEEINEVENWNMSPYIGSQKCKEYSSDLIVALE